MTARGKQVSSKQASDARAASTRYAAGRAAGPAAPAPTGLAELQRMVGNRAVHGLLSAQGVLRRVGSRGSRGIGAMAPAIVHETLRAGGAPLPAGVNARMARRFGRDFSRVRVHTDVRAEASARAVGARAYTVGQHIVFARGELAPGTPAGERLLAHELAHTIQQGGSGVGLQRQIAIGRSDDPAEAAADRMAEHALRDPHAAAGAAAHSLGSGAPVLRRQPADPLLDIGTGDPQSLTGSVQFSSPQMVQLEINAILRWLRRRPPGPDDAQTIYLRGELARLKLQLGPTPQVTTVWDAFARLFNKEFAGVLNVFSAPGTPAAPLTPDRLEELFTNTQREKLQDFILTGLIPDRLFNGTDRGTTSAQQRLLLSAHILAKGKYRPGAFEQRVHAQFCFHWVQIVHHYAGATPPGAGFSGGVMGTFDPKGAAVITVGKGTFEWHKKYVYKPNLPEAESPSAAQSCDTGPLPEGAVDQPPQCGVGPLHAGTKHAEAAEKVDPAKSARFHRQPSIPFDQFDTLRAGDWLWYYNANGSEGGAHSVIFSHWETGKNLVQGDANYRVAVVWSQPTSNRGGGRHTARLGDQFVPNPKNNLDPLVTPITHISRVTPDTGPAVTAAEMLPGVKNADALKRANEATIKQKEKALKKVVDPNKLKKWLRDKNEAFMASLGTHLDPGQRRVLTAQVNQGEDLQTLIRLYQLLRRLHINASLLDAGAAAYYAKLDPAHKAAKEKKAAAGAAAAKEIVDVDALLASLKSDTKDAGEQRAALDAQPRIDLIMREADKLQREIWKMKPGPDRDDQELLRQHLLHRADAARVVQRDNSPALAKLTADLAKLAARKSELEARRAKALKARDTAAAIALPFGIVHPGDFSKEDKRSVSGSLKDIDADIEWSTVMDPAPIAPPATAPKKP